MPAFQRQPSAISSAARPASGFSTNRATAWAPPPSASPARDVAVGGRGRGRRDAEDARCRRSAASRAAAAAARAKAATSGIRWSDGITSTIAAGSRRAARQAASVTAASVSRPSGSSAISICDPGLARLVGDQEPRAARADHDRRREELAGEPRERALERRGAAEDRHVLLGEVLPRHRPEPRARPAAEDRRHDRPPRAGLAPRGQLRHGRVPSASGLSAGRSRPAAPAIVARKSRRCSADIYVGADPAPRGGRGEGVLLSSCHIPVSPAVPPGSAGCGLVLRELLGG